MHKTGSSEDTIVLSIWFEVALVHIPYTAEFINKNQRIKLALNRSPMEYRIALC